MTDDSMIGQTISHYTVLEKLGEGGMGIVYKAQDLKLDRIVALKFLPPILASSPDDSARFEQEAKAISALNHPAIATIHDIDEVDGRRFLVLEFISGGTLKSKVKKAIIENKEIPVVEVVKYGIQIAEGLASAHRAGIVHRDVKSDNAMLTTEGNVKLADFGLAKLQSAAQLTKVGSTIGTAAYMSPEQMRGEDVDGRSDVFSLGVVLYELATKQMPFRGEHDAALAYSIVNEEPRPTEIIRPDIPGGLSGVISKCLEKDLTKRYQTADEVARDLRNLDREVSGTVKTVIVKQHSKLSWIIASVVLVLGAIGVYLFMPASHPTGTDRKTIAVLPFVNMSSDPDQEYFSDGLSEELLNVLAKNPGLRVTSRTSSFSFKGTNTDIQTIAAKLQVQHILEGSVRRSGNILRITAQLIDVETDAHLWSETYDGTMDNVFAVQDTISQAVAEVLKIVLMTHPSVTQQRETDPEAYNAYLLGKYFYDQQNDLEAARYFKQALSIDSSYAPAWLGLSRTHSSRANDGLRSVDEEFRQSKRAVERALLLDPNFAAAHAQVGWIKRRYDWDWSGADQAYQRALELGGSGNASVVSGAAGLARTLGRFDEAIGLMRRAIEVDPVSAQLHNNLGLYSWYAGLLEESCAAYRKCLDLNPRYPGAHAFLSAVYLEKGRPDSALTEALMEPRGDWHLYGLALVYHALGRKKESDDALNELVREYPTGLAYQIAEIHSSRGDADKAFEWLERAYDQRDGGLPSIKGNPNLRNIEKDPRYATFMKKMKLPL